MKNLILTLIITLPLTLWGQGWEQTFGGAQSDKGYSIEQTIDGGFILTGSTFSKGNGERDVFLLKTDNNGGQLWLKTYGGLNNDEGFSVKQTSDQGYIVCGRTNSFGNNYSDIYVIKTDINGDTIWTKVIGGNVSERGYSIEETDDDGYIILGYSNSYGNGLLTDIYLVKLDSNGNQQWDQVFTQTNESIGNSVKQTQDGGYIICGSKRGGLFGENDVFIIKTNSNGIEQWNKTYGGNNIDEGHSILQTLDGGFIITGSKTNLGELNKTLWIIKTDINGDTLWTNTFNNLNYSSSEGYSVLETSSGDYIICGIIEIWQPIDKQYVYIIKIDNNGNQIWYNLFSKSGYSNEGQEICETNDGGFIIIGSSSLNEGSGYNDIYLIKTDDQGNITSTTEIPLPNPNRKLEKIVNLIGQEVNPQTNTPIIEIFDDGSTQKKIIIE
jgi:hypothetical protein